MEPELAHGSYSLIFWYTGVTVWFAIALVLAAACGIAAIVAVAQTYHAARKWRLAWSAVYLNKEERAHFFSACRWEDVTQEEWRKFLRIIHRHRRSLKKQSRLAHYVTPTCSEWYELNDGTVGQVVSRMGCDFESVALEFRLLGADWIMRLRGDGVCVDNPRLRVIRRIERPKESGIEGEPLDPVKPLPPYSGDDD